MKEGIHMTHEESIGSEISAVSKEDRTRAIETLVLAFASDPQLRFLFPDPLQYQTNAFYFIKPKWIYSHKYKWMEVLCRT